MSRMPLRTATVRDTQSAEYLKSLALTERRPGEALPLWQAARALDPDSATLVSHEALALLDQRAHRKAIDLLVPAVRRWPRHVHLMNLLGVALFESEHPREAIACFEHCLRLDAEYPAAADSIANARARLKHGRPATPAVRHAIDAAAKAAAAQSRPTLAVCMIVKDESEFIEGAIGSVRGLADQVVVVDTGSTDDTVERARAAGAELHFFPWTGDFSAARNVSLDHARTDWVLVLDADERVTPRSRTAVRSIMEEYGDVPRVVCPRIHNYTRDGRFMNDGFSGRLFRNRPDMRFSGRVHEEVGRDMPAVSTDYRLDFELDHYGADPDVMREKAKDSRNTDLLQARLAEAPDDLLTWFYLGSQHWLGARREEAGEAFRRVVELFERNPSRYGMAVRNVPVPYSYVGLVRALIDQGRAAEAIEAGNRGLARFPDNPDLWYHTAFALIRADDLPTAARYLQRAMDAKPGGYGLISMSDHTIRAWRARRVLGDVAYELEDREAAYAHYHAVYEVMPDVFDERVVVAARLVELGSALGQLEHLAADTLTYLTLRPSELGVGLQVAGMLSSRVGPQAAYDLLTALFEQVEALRDSVDLSMTIGHIAEQAGEDAEALRWYERVVNAGHRDPRFYLNLAQVFLRQGQRESAAEAFEFAQRLMDPGAGQSG